MKHLRDSVNPEVREFIKQFTKSQSELKRDKQTSTDESNSSFNQSENPCEKVKEVFFKLPNDEAIENIQPYLKVSKTPQSQPNLFMESDKYTDAIVQKVVQELERRNYCKRKPLLSIQKNTVSVSVTPNDYFEDDSFIRQIQQTLLSPNPTPKKMVSSKFETFDMRQKQFQARRDQNVQKQREAQQISKLVDDFKCYLIRTRGNGGF